MAASQLSRVEVVTRTERRRRYSTAEKLRFVRETYGSSVSAVARRHEMSASLLFSWRSLAKAGKLVAETPMVDEAPTEPCAQLSTAGFLQLDGLRVEPSAIRVCLPSGIVLDFPTTLEPSKIAAVVEALQKVRR